MSKHFCFKRKYLDILVFTRTLTLMQSLKFSSVLTLTFIVIGMVVKAQTDTLVLPNIPLTNDTTILLDQGFGDTAGVLTFRSSKIIAKDFNRGNRYDPYQLIQGKIPGVVISRPGGDPNYGYQVQIRGLHSAIYNGFALFPTTNGYTQQFNQTQPLVVVDGIPGVSLQTIDPQDIASIEVIKDAASLAAYGMRGANGVVLIETKKGNLGARGLQYSSYIAIDEALNPELGIDAATYRRLIGPKGTFQGFSQDLGATTDWYQPLLRSGFSQAHNLALNGTALNAAYRLAINFRNVNGIAQKSGFEQVNALFNIQKKLAKGKGQLDGLLAINTRNTTEVNPDIFRNAALMNPTAPVFSDTAALSGSYYNPNLFALFNPIEMLNLQTRENNHQVLTTGLTGTMELFKGVSAKVQSAFQHNRDAYGWALAKRVLGYSGNTTWEERKLSHWYLNAALQGNWTWQRHQLQTQLGYTYQRWDGRGVLREGYDITEALPSYRPLIDVKGNPDFLVSDDPYRESDELLGVYVQTQYSFKQRWFVQGSLRREGFTRLGENKWALYPAFTLGGFIIPQNNAGNYLKIHTGFGMTGNIPPKNYITQQIILTGGPNAFINGEFKPGIYYPFVQNPNLQAELRKEINVGLDFALFKQRLQGQIQVYQSRSSNLLWQYSNPERNGFSDVHFENLMALKNQGVEVQLNLNAIQSSSLNWQSNLSLAHNQTVLDAPFPKTSAQSEVNSLEVGLVGSPGFCCGFLQKLEYQQPIGQFYTLKSGGIGADGQWIIQDQGNKTLTGNAQASVTLGWDNTLQWHRLSVNVFWRAVIGHDLINVFDLFYANPQNLLNIPGFNIPAVALSDRYAKLRAPFNYVSDYYIQNASFLRLDNLSLGYDVPWSKANAKRSLFIYLSAQNLLTITQFNGNDPEIRLSNVGATLIPGLVNPNYWGNPRDLSGIDRGRYPLTQTWVLGVKMKL